MWWCTLEPIPTLERYRKGDLLSSRPAWSCEFLVSQDYKEKPCLKRGWGLAFWPPPFVLIGWLIFVCGMSGWVCTPQHTCGSLVGVGFLLLQCQRWDSCKSLSLWSLKFFPTCSYESCMFHYICMLKLCSHLLFIWFVVNTTLVTYQDHVNQDYLNSEVSRLLSSCN